MTFTVLNVGSDTQEIPEQDRARPLSDGVYDMLISALVSLGIPPGGRLSVDALARQFGVSQTPIRAALIRLQTEGLVVRKHNAGFCASPLPTQKQFSETYLMRSLLEPEAAAQAAINSRGHDVQKLEELCEKMQCQVDDDTERNYGRFAMLDREFHAHIVEISDNELMRHILDNLHAHMHLFRLRYHASVAQEAIKEHIHIVEGIRQRDPIAARSAMAEHISASRKRMEPYYQRLSANDAI